MHVISKLFVVLLQALMKEGLAIGSHTGMLRPLNTGVAVTQTSETDAVLSFDMHY